MNVIALMAKVGKLQEENPLLKTLIGQVMSTVQQDPKILSDVGAAVERFAELKGMSVEQLVSSGALTRAITEFATSRTVTKESVTSELLAFKCKHCNGTNYHLEKQICSETTTKSP